MSNTAPSNPTEAEVAAILEALRAEVRARRQARGGLEPGPLERELRRSLDEIELHRVVSAHWPLTARTLPGRALNLVNKVVRYGLRWYINPIVAQQNAYNDAVARSLRLLADAYRDLEAQVAELAAEGGGRRDGGEMGPERSGPSINHSALMSTVQVRGAAEPPARFPDLELRGAEGPLREREQVSAHWPLAGRTPVEQAVALWRRVVRQYLRWLINPIVEQQNAANAALTGAILALTRVDAAQRAEVARLRAEVRRQASGVRRHETDTNGSPVPDLLAPDS